MGFLYAYLTQLIMRPFYERITMCTPGKSGIPTYSDAEMQKVYLAVAKNIGLMIAIKLVLFYGIRKAAKFAANNYK